MLLLSFAILACDLISEKSGHDILLKLEKELMNYNAKIKQEQISLEKEKQTFVAGNPPNNSNSTRPVLSKESQVYLEQQISKSKELEKSCNEIIQITSKTIKEMDELYNNFLKLETDVKYIKVEFDKARSNANHTRWGKSSDNMVKVHKLSEQAQSNISPAKYWIEETKRIYQSLKGSIETAMSVLNYTYQLGEEIETGQLPENWTIRIVENNQSLNDIIKKCEATLKEYDEKQKSKNFIKELERDVQEALHIIKYTS